MKTFSLNEFQGPSKIFFNLSDLKKVKENCFWVFLFTKRRITNISKFACNNMRVLTSPWSDITDPDLCDLRRAWRRRRSAAVGRKNAILAMIAFPRQWQAESSGDELETFVMTARRVSEPPPSAGEARVETNKEGLKARRCEWVTEIITDSQTDRVALKWNLNQRLLLLSLDWWRNVLPPQSGNRSAHAPITSSSSAFHSVNWEVN